jgi:hypothetical protein
MVIDEINEMFTNIYPAFPVSITEHRGEIRQCLALNKLEGIDEYCYPLEVDSGEIIRTSFVAIKVLDREAMEGWGSVSDGVSILYVV